MYEKPKKGRPSKFKPEYVEQAEKLCRLGATDREVSAFFNISEPTLHRWKAQNEDFRKSLKVGKDAADERVESSLYRRATGYSFDSIKIMQDKGRPVIVPFVEHVAPDTTACIFWLKNRKPEEWRDASRLDLTNSDRSLADAFAGAVANANGLTREAKENTGGDRTNH